MCNVILTPGMDVVSVLYQFLLKLTVTVPSTFVASGVFHRLGVQQIAAIVSGCTQHLYCLHPEYRPGFRRTAPVENVNIFEISTIFKAIAE